MRTLTNRLLPRSLPSLPRIRPDRQPAAVPPLRPRVEIALRDPAPELDAVAVHRGKGRHLARQDKWETLCEAILTSDTQRAKTPGLVPEAMLLAEGARSDAVNAARGAISRGEPRGAYAAIASLEVNLEDLPHCPGLAAVVALAHVDIARFWRRDAAMRDLPPQRREAHDRHLRSAAELADRFDPFETDSPLWAFLRCAVLDVDLQPMQRVADDYEDLIDLDPTCPDHLRSLGRDLLPTRFGTWESLDLQARRTAARTADIWGNGGYAWVWMGALEHDGGAARRVDAELFVAGLHDILGRHPDQHMVNRLAAFTGVTMATGTGQDAGHARIAGAFGWITQNHLQELHPMVWAQAPAPGLGALVELEQSDLLQRGRSRALSTIAEFFAPQLGRSGRLVFDDKGLTFA